MATDTENSKLNTMAENKLQIANVGDQVINRIQKLGEAGFRMPADFNAVVAIKMSMLKLQELKDKNGKPALEVCTSASIQTALFKMACRGLNMALNQCYPVVYGTKLEIMDSYFGKVLMVKRIFPDWEPHPRVIREGDMFQYEIDPKTGKMHLLKHEQKLENIDKDFIGGYIYLPTKDGEGELYVMTKRQIMAAWSKSSNRDHTVAKLFDEKMISKTLINSGCNMIINSTPDFAEANAVAGESESTRFEDTIDDQDYQDMLEPSQIEPAPAQEQHPSEGDPEPAQAADSAPSGEQADAPAPKPDQTAAPAARKAKSFAEEF